MQLKQNTVASSDEMGPHIYHKVIPERYRDMISPQPHFMASFLDPRTGHVWPSAVFGVPGFADPDASDGRRIDLGAQLDPRDGAALRGLVKTGTPMGGVVIDLMSRRRNRFNGEVLLTKTGWAMRIIQAFGNCPKYITRRRVAALGANAARAALPAEQRPIAAEDEELLQKTDMMYLATGHKDQGADMNVRGGQPGFVKALGQGRYIAWPDYVGNGFFMSLGNTKLNPQAGVLVVDWDDTGRGLQILGTMETYEREEIEKKLLPEDLQAPLAAMLSDERQALRVAVLKVELVRSIPGYCPHRYEKVELSPYNPKPQRELSGGGHEFAARLQWARPESDQVATFEFQLAPIPRPGSLELRSGQHVRLGLPALGQGVPPERTWTVTSAPSWFHEHGRFQISVQHKKDGLVTPFLHKQLAKGLAQEEDGTFIFHGFSGEFSPLLDPSTGEYRSRLPRHVVFFAGGIGITPAIAALKGLVDRNVAPESFTLFYSFRELEHAAFLGFLLVSDELKKKLPQLKLKIVVNITSSDAKEAVLQLRAHQARVKGAQEALFLEGRMDASLKAQLPAGDVEGFVCGPAAFEKAAAALWQTASLPSARLRTESFAY